MNEYRSVRLWKTSDEVHFVTLLGLHDPPHRYRPLTVAERIACLTAYVKTMPNRMVWDGVKPVVVREAAFDELMRLHALAARGVTVEERADLTGVDDDGVEGV